MKKYYIVFIDNSDKNFSFETISEFLVSKGLIHSGVYNPKFTFISINIKERTFSLETYGFCCYLANELHIDEAQFVDFNFIRNLLF